MICRGGLHRFDPRLVHVAALALAWMLALGLPAGAQKQGGASLQDQSNGDADALKQRNKELEKLRGEQSKSAEAEAALQRQEIAHLMRVSMLGELSGSLAHELTQPLTAILSNAQAAKLVLAHDAPDLQEVSEVLDDIITEDSRAGEVIHRLRGLLKKDASEYEVVDLNDLINSTLRLLHSELINRRITINSDQARPLHSVLGDPVQLQQVLINLLINAMDAIEEMSPSRRTITVSTSMTDDGSIEVRISDRGTGLRPRNVDLDSAYRFVLRS